MWTDSFPASLRLPSPRCRLRTVVCSIIAALVLNENLIIYNRRRAWARYRAPHVCINIRVSVWVCLFTTQLVRQRQKRHVPLFTARAATCRRTSPWLRSSLAAFCLICGRRRLDEAWRIKNTKRARARGSPRTCCDFALSLRTHAVHGFSSTLERWPWEIFLTTPSFIYFLTIRSWYC